jgi:hypothetical protein
VPDDEEVSDQLALARTEGQRLVGLPLDEAAATATARGFTVRLARQDATQFVMTMDLSFRRINLEVENGRVVAAFAG